MTAEGRELPRKGNNKLHVVPPPPIPFPRQIVVGEVPRDLPNDGGQSVPLPRDIDGQVDRELWNDMVVQRRLGEVIEDAIIVGLESRAEAYLYRLTDPHLRLSSEEQRKDQAKLDANGHYVKAVTALADYSAPRVADTIKDYADSLGEERAQEVGRAALIDAAKSWRYTDHSFTEYARAQMVQALRNGVQENDGQVQPVAENENLQIVASVTRKNGVYLVSRADGTTVKILPQELALLNIPANVNTERSTSFTNRDVEIMTLRGKGFDFKEIAVKLRLSEATIKNYQSKLFKKVSQSFFGMERIANSYQVYACMYKLGLIQPDESTQDTPRLAIQAPKLNSVITVGNLKITLRELSFLKKLLEEKSIGNVAEQYDRSSSTITNHLARLHERNSYIDNQGRSVTPSTLVMFAQALQTGLFDIPKRIKIDTSYEKQAVQEKKQSLIATVTRKNGVYTVSFPDGTTSTISKESFPFLKFPESDDELAIGTQIRMREVEIMTLMGQGLSREEIGTKLGLSRATIRNYLFNLNEKLALELLRGNETLNNYQIYTLLDGLGLVPQDSDDMPSVQVYRSSNPDNSQIYIGNFQITLRELNILKGLLEAKLQKDAASELDIEDKNIRNILSRLRDKNSFTNDQGKTVRPTTFALFAQVLKAGLFDEDYLKTLLENAKKAPVDLIKRYGIIENQTDIPFQGKTYTIGHVEGNCIIQIAEKQPVVIPNQVIQYLGLASQGYGRNEIAELLGISETTYKHYMSKARDSVRTFFGETHNNDYKMYAFLYGLGLVKQEGGKGEFVFKGEKYKARMDYTPAQLKYLRALLEEGNYRLAGKKNGVSEQTVKNNLTDLYKRNLLLNQSGEYLYPDAFSMIARALKEGVIDINLVRFDNNQQEDTLTHLEPRYEYQEAADDK